MYSNRIILWSGHTLRTTLIQLFYLIIFALYLFNFNDQPAIKLKFLIKQIIPIKFYKG